MKKITLLALCVFLLIGCSKDKESDAEKTSNEEGEVQGTASTSEFSTAASKLSYSMGYHFLIQLKSYLGDSVDASAAMAGFKDATEQKKERVSQEALRAARDEFHKKLEEKNLSKAKDSAEEEKEFLEKNAKKDGVVTLDSGLQYEIITSSNNKEGKSPKLSDTVVCHYHGTLPNGTVFDSSVKRGEPATFMLGQVIKGWQEGVQLMTVGDKWRFFVPSALAYGDRAVSPEIGPNQLLIFEVELIDVK